MTFDKVFKIDIVLCFNDVGTSFVRELVLDLQKLFLDYFLDLVFVTEYFNKLVYFCCKLCDLVIYLLSFKTRKTSECHFNYRLCLNFAEFKCGNEVSLRIRNRFACADGFDDLINYIYRTAVALVYMELVTCLFKIKVGSSDDDLFLMLNVSFKNWLESEYLRYVINKCDHICREGILELGILIKLIKYYLRVGIVAVFKNDSHTVASRFVSHLHKSVYSLFLDKIVDRRNECALVYLIGYFGYDNSVIIFLYFRL